MVALAAATLLSAALGARSASLVGGSLLLAWLAPRLRECGKGAFRSAKEVDQLRAENVRLEEALADTERFLNRVPTILIALDSTGRITRWNPAARDALGLDARHASRHTLDTCGVKWLHATIREELARWLECAAPSCRCPDLPYRKDGETRLLGLEIHRAGPRDRNTGYIVTGTDLTHRRNLEQNLQQAQKLEAVGQLAAGLAHEINTPIQYVADNIRFLRDAFEGEKPVLAAYETLRHSADGEAARQAALHNLAKAIEDADLDYWQEEIPKAVVQALEGVERVAAIVAAMKEFAHPGRREKNAANLNKALLNTLIVARNELKQVADVETEFGNLPAVVCHVGEINQVFLNLLINAAHAIAEGFGQTGKRGKIRVRTWTEANQARIAISDTGCGIPAGIHSKVFDPFFTNKPVGKGSGQGLSIARSIVVEKHGGTLTFEPNGTQGTTFLVSLPLEPAAESPQQQSP
jgi:PAS domain S-box-containing protein